MYFDALTIAAVADECQRAICGGHIRQTVQTDDLTVGLEIYAQHQRRYLIASANARDARVYLTGIKLRRGVDTPYPLLLLMRMALIGVFMRFGRSRR